MCDFGEGGYMQSSTHLVEACSGHEEQMNPLMILVLFQI